MNKKRNKTDWNLGLLYDSIDDPNIEADMQRIEKEHVEFVAKYDRDDHAFVKDDNTLLEALNWYEKLEADALPKPLRYMVYSNHLDSSDTNISARLQSLSARQNKIEGEMAFFTIALGKCDKARRQAIIGNDKFAHFVVYLERMFDDYDHMLTVGEEKVLSAKSLPAYEMWVHATEKAINAKLVPWKGKKIPVAEAFSLVQVQKNTRYRNKLQKSLNATLMKVADMAEAEINAIVTNKKIDDELRKFGNACDATVHAYRNNPNVVNGLVKVVTDNFAIAHRFYKLKAKLLKLKKLGYGDRSAKIGTVSRKFRFDDSVESLKDVFGGLDARYRRFMEQYIENGQIDVFPKRGKHGGAYCSGAYNNPTFILLNHTDNLNAFTTVAHELGHAFHTELSQKQGPIYVNYSTSLAETASTLFESIALEAVYEKLSDKEKIIVLHDKINDDIATIFRQIACFNFEKDMHEAIRSKGYLSKNEIAALHNKNMKAYLGPVFGLDPDDGYMFVQWSHIRKFFYVYTYAYGQLVSKALLNRYKADKSFWQKIEQFLSAGGSKSPEKILLDIGIDVSKPDFFRNGLREIERDIDELEKLTKK